jgi:hypothetical protein
MRKALMGHQPGVKLSVIKAKDVWAAIKEFNSLGRGKFLKRYGFSRASKFYLIHEQRIYDTKALIGAAYRHATGRRLSNEQFAGGVQTKSVFRRIKQEARFRDSEVFEDTFGELNNLSASSTVSHARNRICGSWASPNGTHLASIGSFICDGFPAFTWLQPSPHSRGE